MFLLFSPDLNNYEREFTFGHFHVSAMPAATNFTLLGVQESCF